MAYTVTHVAPAMSELVGSVVVVFSDTQSNVLDSAIARALESAGLKHEGQIAVDYLTVHVFRVVEEVVDGRDIELGSSATSDDTVHDTGGAVAPPLA